MQPLTKRQREVYDFLVASIDANGYAPSLTEIGAALGLSSLATVHKHLENLKSLGYILRYWNMPRAIVLTARGGCCPTCGQKLSSEAKVSIETERKVCDDKSAGEGAVTPTPT